MTNPSCVGGQGLREIVIDHRPRFIKPLLPVFRRTVRDHAKHDSVKNAHSAKIKYTILPDTFQRIAEDVFFPLLWRIGCIEDQRGFGFQEADGQTSAVVAFRKARSTRSTHPFMIAGGCPHQFGWMTMIPSASRISR